MKIVEIVAHPLVANYDQPSWTAHEYFDRAQLILVEVRTDQGVAGFGEIAGGPQKLICDLLKAFGDAIKGMNPLDHERIWRTLFSLTSPRPGSLGS